MTLAIAGMGTALPTHRMTQQQALQLHADIVCENEKQRRLTRMLFRKAAVSERFTVLPHQMAYEWHAPSIDPTRNRGPSTGERMQMYARHAPDLAFEASHRALEDAGIQPEEITHLVLVSCTGFDAPGVDIALIKRLGLDPTTQRICVGFMGCHGAINGLRTASGLIAEHASAKVLICAVECCSLHYRFSWDDEGIIGNALFADGAAALIGVAGHSAEPCIELLATGSCLIDDSEEAMSWRIGDYGFEMQLASDIAEHISGSLRAWLDRWLDEQGLSLEALGQILVHPGGPRILEAVQESLDMSKPSIQASYDLLRSHGNMSSPTILFLLQRAIEQRVSGTILLLAFGPGLVAEAALLSVK